MKQEFDNLDELLQNKVEEASFPMKEEYWQRMTTLLDNEEKKKRKPFPFWRGLSVILLLIATGLGAYMAPKFMVKKSKHASASMYTSASATTTTETPSTETTSQNNTESKEEASYTAQQNNNNISEPASSLNKTTTQNQTSSNSLTPAFNKETHAQSTAANSSSTPLAQVAQTNNNQAKNPSGDVNAIAEEQLNNAANNNTPSNIHPKVNKAEKIITSIKKSKNHANPLSPVVATNRKSSKVLEDAQKNMASNSVKNKKSESNKSSSNPELENIESNKPEEKESVVVNGKYMKPKDTTVYKSQKSRDESVFNPRYIASLQNYVPEKIDCTIIYTYSPIAEKSNAKTEEAISAPTKEESASEEQKKALKRLELFAQLGMNINKGFKGNTDNQTKWAYSPYISAGVQKEITPKLSLAGGIGFTYFNGVNLVESSSSYTYSFGIDSIQSNLYTKKLFQLYAPLSIYYQLLKKHYLMLGAGASYSFQTSGTLEEKSYAAQPYTSSTATNNLTKSNSTIVTNYSKGFQNFDIFLQAGYSYQVMNGLYLQATLQQGIFDISKNAYYKNAISNSITRFGLGIKYNFNLKGRK